MANRDADPNVPEGEAKPKVKKSEKTVKKPAAAGNNAKAATPQAKESLSEAMRIGPWNPRRPIQVIQHKGGSGDFWVFCDDGSVWTARYKKGQMRWTEAGPPLPGSPAGGRSR